jgi:hypothetical protein
MSDDSFIREVDEELRHDRARDIWKRFGPIIIGVAVAAVVATAAWRGWVYYSELTAAQAGDDFVTAVELSAQGKHDEAIAQLKILETDSRGAYGSLARLRTAGELQEKGDIAGAKAAYDAIAADRSVDEAFRSIARLRAGLIAVDDEDYPAVKARLESLAAAGGYFRHLAREGLGLSAYKAGVKEEALGWFQAIADDAAADSNVRSRAGIMLNLLAGQGVKQAG